MLEEIVRSLAARTGGRCRIAVAAAAQGSAQAFLSALARACGGEAEEGSMRAPLPGGELSAFLGEGECEAAVLVTALGAGWSCGPWHLDLCVLPWALHPVLRSDVLPEGAAIQTEQLRNPAASNHTLRGSFLFIRKTTS